MRCFVALAPPDGFAEAVSAWTAGLAAPGWRWSRSEGLHLTLAFLGEVGEAAVLAAQDTVTEAGRLFPPVVMRFRGPVCYPSSSKPRVLALEPAEGRDAAVAAWDGFNRLLAERAEAAGLGRLNAEWPDGRPFRPHLTLARAAGRGLVAAPSGAIADGLPLSLRERMEFGNVVLFESISCPGGSRYVAVARARLRGIA